MARIESHPILSVPSARRQVRFTFDGEPLLVYQGEMRASALMANGVFAFSHHRRGIHRKGSSVPMANVPIVPSSLMARRKSRV